MTPSLLRIQVERIADPVGVDAPVGDLVGRGGRLAECGDAEVPVAAVVLADDPVDQGSVPLAEQPLDFGVHAEAVDLVQLRARGGGLAQRAGRVQAVLECVDLGEGDGERLADQPVRRGPARYAAPDR